MFLIVLGCWNVFGHSCNTILLIILTFLYKNVYFFVKQTGDNFLIVTIMEEAI